MTQNEIDLTDLDALFEEAKSQDAPEDLMARVLEDALAAQPVPIARVKPGLRAQIAAVLGGWQGIGGLVAATCAGIWIGITPPANLPVGLEGIVGVESFEIDDVLAQQDPSVSGFGWDLEEG